MLRMFQGKNGLALTGVKSTTAGLFSKPAFLRALEGPSDPSPFHVNESLLPPATFLLLCGRGVLATESLRRSLHLFCS